MGTVNACMPYDDTPDNKENESKVNNPLDDAKLQAEKYINDERFKSLDAYSKVMVAYSSALEPEDDVKMNSPSINSEDFTEIIVPEIGKYVANSNEESDQPDQLGYIKRVSSLITDGILPGQKDQFKKFKSNKDGMQFRNKYWNNLPKQNVQYNHKNKANSDETVSKFAFSGMGAHYLRKINRKTTKCLDDTAVFMSDFSVISFFKVRSDFEKYGAIAYFDRNTKLIGMYWCHKKV